MNTADRNAPQKRMPSLAPWLIIAACSAVVGLFSGCSSGRYASPETTVKAAAPAYTNEVLHEGDLISITCETVTNINTTVKIPLNGKLDLAFIGQVQAAGKTTQELQDKLLELYKPQVRAEVITVKLIQPAARVYVAGAVLQPGKIPMDRPMTVLEAIMEAGGYDPENAKLSKVTVVRLEDGRQKVYRVNVQKIVEGVDPRPFYLKPFDTVQVPRKSFRW